MHFGVWRIRIGGKWFNLCGHQSPQLYLHMVLYQQSYFEMWFLFNVTAITKVGKNIHIFIFWFRHIFCFLFFLDKLLGILSWLFLGKWSLLVPSEGYKVTLFLKLWLMILTSSWKSFWLFSDKQWVMLLSDFLILILVN